ncbi:hypothetical protein TNCV_3555351 [Trichonephila clavipes]|nr:hypothetical protein TNCV_3555351 [Trichonephila clavipes]
MKEWNKRWAGQNLLRKTVADEVRKLMKEMPYLLQSDWSRPIIAESGRGRDWVDPKINDPKQGDLEIKINQDPIEIKGGNKI